MKNYKVEAWPWCADYCKKNQWNPHDSYFWDKAMLEYRRQHNIFEVGDKVVDTNYKDSDVQEIKSISGNRMNVFHKNKSYYFATFVFSFRHATDEEIKAGKRL